MRHQVLVLALAFLPASIFSAPPAEPALLGVHSDPAPGRPTASGAFHDPAAMTAAHPSLPFGTWIRVANFESGRMADVCINDRTSPESRMVLVSRAAADSINLSPGRTVQGSFVVIPPPHASAAGPSLFGGFAGGATSAQRSAAAEGERRFRPFAGLFGRDGANAAPGAAASETRSATQSSGLRGLFKGPQPPPAAYPDPVPYPSVADYAPAAAGASPLLPMNAPIPPHAVPGPALAPPPSSAGQLPPPLAVAPAPSPAALPPASPTHPYRVQFGAYRRLASAEELSGMLRGAGIPNSVFAAPGTGLNLVVTEAGFTSAEEAQRWIDFEAARRGWTERPVVLR